MKIAIRWEDLSNQEQMYYINIILDMFSGIVFDEAEVMAKKYYENNVLNTHGGN